MDELSIHIALNNGDCTTLYVFARRKNTLFKSEDAKEYGESPFQLQEGCMYDFELDKNSYYLQEDRDILTNSKSRQAISRGCISTGIYVGTYSIDVLQKEDNKKVGEAAFEIRSAKVGYRDDYRRMLEDITEFCTELLMQQSSPVIQRYEVDITKDPRSDYQRFAFVRSLVDSDSFADAMYQIQLSPVKRWIDSEEERQLCNVKRWGQHTLRQLARATNRVSLSNQHPLKDRFDTLPRCVPVAFRKETADIPENRFIKYVLRSFLTFCSSIQHHSKAGQRLKQEASLVCEKLLQYLSYPLFRNISEINVLPLNSPILQRKEGYREIFQKWLMFDMAARLTWQGGEDVYGAGKKDLEVLNALRLVHANSVTKNDTVTILETNIDTLSGEVLGSLYDKLLSEGARDVTITPTIMKKNRPGQIIKVICRNNDAQHITNVLMEETGTLGVRVIPTVHRGVAIRENIHEKININGTWEDVRFKIGYINDKIIKCTPEYDDIKKIANKTSIPIKDLIKYVEMEYRINNRGD